MNRKFRAKSLETKEWVYGYYLYIEEQDKHYILTGKIKPYTVDAVHNHLTVDGFECIEVDGDTVCSIVIDLIDDDDSELKIYEGDIVEVTLTQTDDIRMFEKNKLLGYIWFDDSVGAYYLKGNFLKFPDWAYNDYKVIGNVYDNKDLLEEIYNVF